MNPIGAVVLAGVATLGVVALGSSSKPKRKAQSEAWRSVHGLPLPPGWSQAKYTAAIDKLPPYGEMPQELKAVYDYMKARWAERQRLLPKDAKPYWQDGYATEHFLVAPYPYPMGGPFASAAANVDQWGRPAVAEHGMGGGDPLGAVLTAAGYVLPFVPGIGPAAAATLATVIALGKGKSLQDAILTGVRAGLPLPARVAFDLGVGVVLQKKPIDQAAKQALIDQIPGGQKAYDLGVAQAKKLGIH